MARPTSRYSNVIVCAPVLLGSLVALCLFDTFLQCAIFIALNVGIVAIRRRSGRELAVYSGVVSAAYLASVIALLSISATLQDTTLEKALIGDSDGYFYNAVATDVALHTPLLRQFDITDLGYLVEAGWRNGGGIKDPGFFWLMGVFYTVVGTESGPEWVVALNIVGTALALSAICMAAVGEAAPAQLGRTFGRSFAAAILFFSSATVMTSVILTVRKDVCVLVLLVFALTRLLKVRYVRALLWALLLFPFRASFLLPLGMQLLLRRMRRPRRIGQFTLASFLVVSLVVPVAISYALGSGLLSRSAILNDQANLAGLSRFLLGQMPLIWVYLAITPPPPVTTLFALSPEEAIGAVLASVSNLALLGFFVTYLRRLPSTEAVLRARSSFIVIAAGLYVVVAAQYGVASAVDSFGIAEPRYKFGIWALQVGMAFAVLCGAVRAAQRAPRLDQAAPGHGDEPAIA